MSCCKEVFNLNFEVSNQKGKEKRKHDKTKWILSTQPGEQYTFERM